MKKKNLIFVLSLALVLLLTACSSVPAAEAETPSAGPQATDAVPSPAEEDGQNPVMNFVGVYSTEYSTEALVEAEGMENAKITVTSAGSPWFHTETVMSGPFDPETLTMEFSGATLTEYTYASDGSIEEETVSHTDTTGRAVFDYADNTQIGRAHV